MKSVNKRKCIFNEIIARRGKCIVIKYLKPPRFFILDLAVQIDYLKLRPNSDVKL